MSTVTLSQPHFEYISAEKAFGIELGRPEEKEEGEWRYYDPRGGFDLLALLVNERLFVTRLRYEKSLFE